MTPVLENSNQGGSFTIGEIQNFPNVYRCHLAILREEDGSFSVLVLNLPGCGSCGDSEDEAIENVREAVVGAVESYVEDGLDVPWQTLDEYTIPEGAKQKWILVNAFHDVKKSGKRGPTAEDRADAITPSNEQLKQLADRYPAPSEWYDEDEQELGSP